MTSEMVLTNAAVVIAGQTVHGTVLVRDGMIADVQSGHVSLPQALDCEGDYLIPGLVELHTDNIENHVLPRSNAVWPVMSALIAHDAQMATAGITTVFDSLCVGMSGTGSRSFDVVRMLIAALNEERVKRIFRSEHLLHLRAEVPNENTAAMFSSIYDTPALRLVSLMDHTPGQRQWRDLSKYIDLNKEEYHKSQPEIDEFIQYARARQRKNSGANRRTVLGLLGGKPITLASHDDTTIGHVEEAYADGIGISEFPTTLEAAEAARRTGMSVLAGAPNLVLQRSHSGNISAEELMRRGLLDVLSSDYVPSSLLQGIFLAAERLELPLHETVKMASLNPARLVGLNDRGSIEAGKRADLVRVRKKNCTATAIMVWREGRRVA